jgi:methionyl aminopeptidase
MIPDNGLFKALKEALFCDLNKLSDLGSNIADKKSPCGIPMEAVKQRAESHGYGVVRELVGHGIGMNMHEAPEVPNYVIPHFGRGARLVPGMAIAIEPMINLGTRRIHVLDDGWTCVTADGKPSAHYENTIFISEALRALA